VAINGVPAPLFYASPAKIRAQVPFEVNSGPATLVVETAGQTTASIGVTIQSVAPGLFMGDQGRARVENADRTLNSSAAPTAAGSEIAAYLTGLGAVTPPLATGAAADHSHVVETVHATVGGKDAQVVFARLKPGSTGVYQVKMIVPDLAPGDYPLRVSAANVPSNTAVISIR
jgi:uncharacterized protein (TIGR03437 family)